MSALDYALVSGYLSNIADVATIADGCLYLGGGTRVV